RRLGLGPGVDVVQLDAPALHARQLRRELRPAESPQRGAESERDRTRRVRRGVESGRPAAGLGRHESRARAPRRALLRRPRPPRLAAGARAARAPLPALFDAAVARRWRDQADWRADELQWTLRHLLITCPDCQLH